MSYLSLIKWIFIVFLELLAGGLITYVIIDRFSRLLVLTPGDSGAWDRWHPSIRAWNQPLESEEQPKESRAEEKAFTLLHESNSRFSAALEHSDRLLPDAPGPNVHVHTADPHMKPGTSSCSVSPLIGVRRSAFLPLRLRNEAELRNILVSEIFI